MEDIKFVKINRSTENTSRFDGEFTVEKAEQVRSFHRSIPVYGETPLAKLDSFAKSHGLGEVYVKDESYRFGLNAFKALGGSYCIAGYIAKQLGLNPSEITFDKLTDPSVKEKLGELTFVTCTDGNHGRGIAWTAQQMGVKSVVYMPKGSAQERLDNIKACGADASITDMNYDDAVRFANSQAEKNGWIMVQDTAWEGYEELPKGIMQGYMTMALEAAEKLDKLPTHIFLQAGVGAMAGGVTGFFTDYYKKKGLPAPVITIVEARVADCYWRTVSADDGKIHNADGDLQTIMAGLACGEPCTIGWEVLKNHADFFASVTDDVAAAGMRALGRPQGTDPLVVSGESGAAAFGFVTEITEKEEYADIRKALGLGPDSICLFFSTEGATDQENYRKILAK